MRSSEPLVQDSAPTIACSSCGMAGLTERRVQLALWQEERLVVVEDVPALVCRGCGERFYDDETTMRLDMLRGTGFPPGEAGQEMTVAVYRLPGQKVSRRG
ncbi:type II toxin-antitoxin system MqsA family antitoxin [Seohaeicola saemankumensis]|uniref:type II toxin-antitoxin system MqsA family antitoxin n=1 Tax=Seohaeicola saemankumensis TaxID=481181 RepID=UPI001E406C33|nr:type II toxin-antitoxin system MqsA family antitoxin [Seohaeicola saemankumensis]MCD1628010.1 type II toxin-antitoxin system MqsA family antitoxin [Seohaeicola saemankumensis]